MIISVIDEREENPRIDQEFKEALLSFGSATEDNTRCVEHVKVGGSSNSGRGFSLRGSDIAVSDILHTVEGEPIPKVVVERFPGVTQEDWDAVLRLSTLLFILFEE
jgi:uncharacterized protein (DUF433 family)